MSPHYPPFGRTTKPQFCTVERLENGYLLTFLDMEDGEQTPPPRRFEPPKGEMDQMKRAIEQQVRSPAQRSAHR